MTTKQPEYNDTGSKYVEWKKRSILMRGPIQDYTILKCMLPLVLDKHGSLTGKRVLDLACGEGYYTRKLKALNCAYILGADISSKMIELARDSEHQSPMGIEYLALDAQKVPPPEKPFDLVTAFHLLSYAQTRNELLQMVRTIYEQLGEDKHFLGVTMNVVAAKEIFKTDKHRKYGLENRIKFPLDGNPIPDGTEVTFTMYDEQGEIVGTFLNYYWSPETHEQVFKEAGFKTFQWIPYQCDPDVPNRSFYDDFVNCPSSIGVMANK